MEEKSKKDLQAKIEELEYDANEFESIIDTADKYLEEINNKIKHPVIKFGELSKPNAFKVSDESSEPEFFEPADFLNGFKFMRKYESLSEELQERVGGIIPQHILHPINAVIGGDARENLLRYLLRILEASHGKLAIIYNNIKKVKWKLGKIDNIIEHPIADPPIAQTPEGTTWPDLEITFIDEDTVMIKVKGEVVRERAYYSDIGFVHKQTGGKKLKAWYTLLKLSKHDGYISFKDNVKIDRHGKPIFEISIDDIRGLKAVLTKCFQLPGESIKPYEVKNCYKTEFILRCLKEGFESYSPNDDD